MDLQRGEWWPKQWPRASLRVGVRRGEPQRVSAPHPGWYGRGWSHGGVTALQQFARHANVPCMPQRRAEEAERRKREKLGKERASRRRGGHVCHPEDRNEAMSAGAREDQIAAGPCPGLGTL